MVYFLTPDSGIYPDPLPGELTGPESCGIAKPVNVISTSFLSQEVQMTPALKFDNATNMGS